MTARASESSASWTASENSVITARSYEFAGGLSSVIVPTPPVDGEGDAHQASPPTTTDFSSTYESSVSMPCSFPKPDAFTPPNGSSS